MINLLPFTRTALLIEGDALLIVSVRSTFTGTSSRTHERIEGFLTEPLDAIRAKGRAIEKTISDDVVLVVPASWCASRPVPMTTQGWHAKREARDELVEAYFPFGAREAIVGLLEFTPAGASETQGSLFVASSSQVGAWRERIEQVFSARIGEVLPSTMCTAGLGLQRHERALVLERDGRELATSYAWGRPSAVAEPFDEDEARDAELYVVGRIDESTRGARQVTPEQLAVGACLLPYVPGVRYRALGDAGKPRLDRRVPLAAAVTLLAVAGVLGSSALSDARARAGQERVEQQMAAHENELGDVQQLRDETTRLASSLDQIAQTTGQWSSVLPELEQALGVVPLDGFAHRIELTPGRVTITGESAKSLAVLESLENTPAFESARQTGTVSRSPRELETFSLQARRATTNGGVE